MGEKLKVVDGGQKDNKRSGEDIGHARICVYFGDQVELLKRLCVLAMKHKGVSISGLVVTCVAACIDTLERDMPMKRTFKLNGKDVEL